jgi:4-hydroxy-2-oxoheptanedioate aldolase
MRINKLKKMMNEGKIAAGMGLFSGDPVFIELMGNTGFDFVFIDTEHTPFSATREVENLVRTADAVGMSAVIRVAANDEIVIRKCFEFGVDAVAIPHARTAEEVRRMVASAKFPPQGVRGAASDCRAAGYGAAPDFDWQEYVARSNKETMIIPMAEDAEFFDNIDEIMEVEGVSSFLFGPTDLAMSMGIVKLYQLDNPVIKEKFQILIKKAKQKNMPLMCPVAPPTLQKAQELAESGVRMMIFRNDVTNFKGMLQGMVKDIVNPIRESSKK